MIRSVGIRIVAAALAAVATSPCAASAGTASGAYELVWADEFDIEGPPDPANWTYETGFVRNTELQWYQSENAFVEDGRLVIEARREHKPNPSFGSPEAPRQFRQRRFVNYTSASVTTRGLHAWRYGRFEVRAKIRAERGLWPAIWTLGVDGKWPAKGEIDILEYYDDAILANFAWAERTARKPHWQSRKIPLDQLSDDPKWDEKFHTWTMDWTEKQITLAVDGEVLNRIDLDTVHNIAGTGVAHPFRQPHYLVLNLALGGQNGGTVKDTKFPSRYEIDYVRVYQRVGEDR